MIIVMDAVLKTLKWWLLAIAMWGGALSAQMVQYGYVVEMNSGGQPIANVAVAVPMAHDCPPTASDANGAFRLSFSEHKIGDVVVGLSARKYGYEVVNKHIVRDGYTLTDRDTLRIVMAPADKLKEARKQYYSFLETAYIHRYDTTMSFLNAQYAQQVITKAELDYWQSLAEAELRSAYQSIDDYADRLACINADDLDEASGLLYDRLQEGDVEPCLSLIGDTKESHVLDDYLVFAGVYPMTNPEEYVAAGDFDLLDIPDTLYPDVMALNSYNERYESDFMTNGLHYAQSCTYLGNIFKSLDDGIMAVYYFRKALRMYELLNEMETCNYRDQIEAMQSEIKSLE